MKKYILLIIVLLTVIFTIASCDSKQAYCQRCNHEVTMNEAIECDGPIRCDHCGYNRVYYK